MSKKGNGCLVFSLDLTIYEMKDGVITGFIFDDRIFKETGRLSDKKHVEEKQETEVPKKVHIEISEKHCQKCNKTKPVSEFNKSKIYGYQSACRDCQKKIRLKYEPKKEPDIKSEKQPDGELKKQPDKPVLKSRKDAFQWTKDKDKIICDNFGKLGVSGIYDKSLFPGFSLAEIRKRCQELNLIDQYGNTK